MTVIVLMNCPPKLRGDMTKWMVEINTGVYVGKLSARVRDALWDRICENIKVGQVTMVYPSNNEQHMEFRVHNTNWEIADFDGIKLMRRPSPMEMEKKDIPALEAGFSKAARNRKIANIQKASCRSQNPDQFVVLDIETTGLDQRRDEIIEIGAIRVQKETVQAEFSFLINGMKKIPDSISELTGITQELLQKEGCPLPDALGQMLDFIGDLPVVCHNAGFDVNFLQAALRKLELPQMRNRVVDTLPLARRKIDGVSNYKLSTVAEYFGIGQKISHRALPDCYTTLQIFLRLNQS